MTEYQYGLSLGWATGGAVGIFLGLFAGLQYHVRRSRELCAEFRRLLHEGTS